MFQWMRRGNFISPNSIPMSMVHSPLHFFSLNPCPVIYFSSAVLNKLWFSDSSMKLEPCGFTGIGNHSFKLFCYSLLYPYCIHYCKEAWTPKNRCFQTVVLEKTLESTLDSKKIKPVHPKGFQSWIFIGRTDADSEAPILWPPDAKSWLIGKDPDAGKYSK